MNKTLRRSTLALLASSLLLTIGRGATLPFMTIYLSRQYDLSVDLIGYAMTIALTIGVVFSLGFGILADKFDKKRYMLLAISAFAFGFIAIPLVDSVMLVVLLFALINCAYSVFATVLKAWFADHLSPGAKAKIFSLNYTVLNIGWTVGPPLGTLLVMQSINLPFWLAAFCSAFPLVFIQLLVKRSAAAVNSENSVAWSPAVLLHDKALFWFTLSAFLASFVSGAFASCLSQYVMVVADGNFAEKVVAVVLPVNAAVVVSLQYAVGRRLTPANIRPLMGFGTVCFVIGLGGFMISGNSLLLWGVSAAIFTLGEVIYAPGEYMLIDNIAPPGMKASYFSAQSLGWLGAAFNPLASGVILTSFPAWTLFIVLMVAIIVAWALMLKGMRVGPWGQPALC
ncbi:TPA: efflux MFS transporter YdeE [Citrobacter amalonaticus]|uniref:efflux MFS transporter YdeE n=1 Tax=Citrobacter amalonaticus TaxID=35703 RepID=UPI000A37D7C7|nr:efflux MFS transporter YdeE [Citrobacter amalonaticus]EKW5057294.1 efflux MFS transporter YdeE [Citrobacter amalonaticus]OUE56122.1 MFS transporter YdeE [Citrobacter amalonaticus]HAU5794519.1 efflux MFS transporter YdeE [Citrobacter amalonaticus]HAZ4785789.1 efflux MFS transporter YdeE [Citrobacter amalonaticus]HEM8517571.1 efflux MFS transporter YdeE [Citrobacter amalonaticus]